MPQPPAATVSISIAIVARPAESDCNEAVVEAIVEIVVLDEMIVVMPIVAMPSTVALVPGNVTTALPTSIPTRELAAMPIFATMSARHMTPREVGAPHASTKVRAAHAAPEVGAAHASTEPTAVAGLAFANLSDDVSNEYFRSKKHAACQGSYCNYMRSHSTSPWVRLSVLPSAALFGLR